MKLIIILSGGLVISVLSNAQNQSKTSLAEPYFGQKPPGMTATIFAQGIVSTDSIEHSSPTFSPDGNLVLWTKIYSNHPAFLVEMRLDNNVWTNPAPPSFACRNKDDFYPDFSVDGRKLYFSSRRSLPPGYPKNEDMWIWVVERKQKGWGTPVPLDSSIMAGFEYAHTVSKMETLFFSSRRLGSFDIFFARLINNKYQTPELMGNGINTPGYEDGPFIAPDESYLIFESQRPESIEGSIDLYICFKQSDGSWSYPKNMGPEINSKYSERFARVSPDGKYLFFGSNRKQEKDNLYFDIYWIDSKIIDKIKSNK